MGDSSLQSFGIAWVVRRAVAADRGATKLTCGTGPVRAAKSEELSPLPFDVPKPDLYIARVLDRILAVEYQLSRKRWLWMEVLTVEPTGEKDYGPCNCCGNNSRCAWGFIHSVEGTVASYFVHWTLSRVADHGANFDLILGKWGEQSTARDRSLVSLAYRLFDTGPQFMVIDCHDRPAAKSELVGQVLRREDVVGQPIAKRAFAMADAILVQDKRVLELLGQHRMV